VKPSYGREVGFLHEYGVDVAAGEDVPLILAITVTIDSLTTRG